MKVAICFSGLLRTFEECYQSYNRIISKYDCDLFAVTQPTEVFRHYPFKKVLMQEDEWIDEKNYNANKNPETIVQNTLRQFYFIELCNNLRIQYEQEKGVKYDFIIRTRMDNVLVNDIPDLNSCDPNSIYIPEGHDHPNSHPGVGINDRFAFGGNHVMNIYSNKSKDIDNYMTNSGRKFHPETIVKWVLTHHNVNIIRFNECTKINRGNNEFI